MIVIIDKIGKDGLNVYNQRPCLISFSWIYMMTKTFMELPIVIVLVPISYILMITRRTITR